jgi:2-keto-3-deoxy-L-fuconate dehydrogenase
MGGFENRVAIVTGAGSGTGAAIATRLAAEGARVVCPSVIDTPTFRATTAGMPREVLDGLLGRQGIRRLARAEEIAAAVYLASDDASYLTGVALPADGGYLAG